MKQFYILFLLLFTTRIFGLDIGISKTTITPDNIDVLINFSNPNGVTILNKSYIVENNTIKIFICFKQEATLTEINDQTEVFIPRSSIMGNLSDFSIEVKALSHQNIEVSECATMGVVDTVTYNLDSFDILKFKWYPLSIESLSLDDEYYRSIAFDEFNSTNPIFENILYEMHAQGSCNSCNNSITAIDSNSITLINGGCTLVSCLDQVNSDISTYFFEPEDFSTPNTITYSIDNSTYYPESRLTITNQKGEVAVYTNKYKNINTELFSKTWYLETINNTDFLSNNLKITFNTANERTIVKYGCDYGWGLLFQTKTNEFLADGIYFDLLGCGPMDEILNSFNSFWSNGQTDYENVFSFNITEVPNGKKLTLTNKEGVSANFLDHNLCNNVSIDTNNEKLRELKVTSDGKLITDIVGTNYEWYKCSTGEKVLNADSNTFAPNDISEEYLVKIETSNCEVFSNCTSIKSLSSTSFSYNRSNKIITPTIITNQTTISIEENSNLKFQIFSLSGKKISTTKAESFISSIKNTPKGIYLISIFDNNKLLKTEKIIRK